MPRRTVLSPAQREDFERLPSKPQELVRHYTLSREDMALIIPRRQGRNRLSFALALCLLRYPGRALRPREPLPRELVAFVAEQTDDAPEDFDGYAGRDETRREHLAFLTAALGLRAFSRETHFQSLVDWLAPVAFENPDSVFLIGALLNEFGRRAILNPGLSEIERVAAAAQTRALRQAFKSVCRHLDQARRQALDAWLEVDPRLDQTRFSWARQSPGAPSAAAMLELLERLKAIEELKLPGAILDAIPLSRRRSLTREGLRVSISHLRDYTPERRWATIAVCLLETSRALADEAVAAHDRLMSKMLNRSRQKQAALLKSQAARVRETLRFFSRLGQFLAPARQEGKDGWKAMDAAAPWETTLQAFAQAGELAESRTFDPLAHVEASHSQTRRWAPQFLAQLDFQAERGSADVLEAVNILRRMNRSGGRKLPPSAPVSFVSKAWSAHVVKPGGALDKPCYELCVLDELRKRLRSGDIWVPGSREHLELDSYLLAPAAFAELLAAGELPVAVETDFNAYIAQRRGVLAQEMERVESLARQGKLEGVLIEGDKLSIKPWRGVPAPESALSLADLAYGNIPRPKITDLLVEVDAWTGFCEEFANLRTGLPAQNKRALLAVILADGINLGLDRMSESCPEVTLEQLRWMADWHVRPECYDKALARIVNAHSRTKLAQAWGDGAASSSDGQRFAAGGRGQGLGQINARHGKKPGVVVYTHFSNQKASYKAALISAAVSEAPHVLDGLLYHLSDLQIEEHYTDTGGFTEHVFAMCHLLGFRFAPRLRGLGDLRLYGFEGKKRLEEEFPRLAPLFADKPLEVEKIRGHWSEILRAAASVRLGVAPASAVMRKLASRPRRDGLGAALRELGKLERTLFTLQWMRDPALRGRVHAGLSDGEARNALARAVFFNKLGEVRDRSLECQQRRASGLNLLVAAIILWNTRQLEGALEKLQAQGHPAAQGDLQHLSPLRWDHIALTGDYFWNINAEQVSSA